MGQNVNSPFSNIRPITLSCARSQSISQSCSRGAGDERLRRIWGCLVPASGHESRYSNPVAATAFAVTGICGWIRTGGNCSFQEAPNDNLVPLWLRLRSGRLAPGRVADCSRATCPAACRVARWFGNSDARKQWRCSQKAACDPIQVG
jgi:hypothetical protein